VATEHEVNDSVFGHIMFKGVIVRVLSEKPTIKLWRFVFGETPQACNQGSEKEASYSFHLPELQPRRGEGFDIQSNWKGKNQMCIMRAERRDRRTSLF